MRWVCLRPYITFNSLNTLNEQSVILRGEVTKMSSSRLPLRKAVLTSTCALCILLVRAMYETSRRACHNMCICLVIVLTIVMVIFAGGYTSSKPVYWSFGFKFIFQYNMWWKWMWSRILIQLSGVILLHWLQNLLNRRSPHNFYFSTTESFICWGLSLVVIHISFGYITGDALYHFCGGRLSPQVYLMNRKLFVSVATDRLLLEVRFSPKGSLRPFALLLPVVLVCSDPNDLSISSSLTSA